MGFFQKLFGVNSQTSSPDNTRLLQLMDRYWKENGKGNTYADVAKELFNGNSFLLLPSQNDKGVVPDKWTTLENGETLKLTSIVNLDGLKAIAVFTDEQSMVNWRGTGCQYTAMLSKDVLRLADENNIDRIVINSGGPNMFVLERSTKNFETRTLKKETKVQVGTPNRPLSNSIQQKLIANFKTNTSIAEVYQYAQVKNGESSIVLGFRLLTSSENAKKAAMHAVQNAFENEASYQVIDLFFIETEDWYQTIKQIQDSLLYKMP